ncbi:MAG: hypothetical protein ACREKR_00210 [Candidatus Methylomirabilales bacterium]
MIQEIVARYLKRMAMAVMASTSLGVLVFSYSDAGPPSCAAFNDPGAVFCEDFEDGDLENWSLAPGMTETMISVANLGSNRNVRLFAKGESYTLLGAGFVLRVKDGEKFWVEWWERYDTNFRWRFGSGPDWANSSHKDLDLRNAQPNGRMLWAPEDGGDNGALGLPRLFFMADQEGTFYFEPGRAGNRANVDPNWKLRPGTAYHFVLEITNAVAPRGAFKFWANGELIMHFSGVQTCSDPAGCEWEGLALGGPQSNTSSSGNYWWYDQIRITRTPIVPWKSPDTTPPNSPTGLRLK